PEAFRRLLKKGYPVDQCPYNINDALESNEDLEGLYEVLDSVKGADGKPAKFTANSLVANPDFGKIRGAGYQKYFFEPFTETLKRYPSHHRLMELYQEGIDKGLIQPQFHGREHLNVPRWMKALQKAEPAVLHAFDEGVFSPKI